MRESRVKALISWSCQKIQSKSNDVLRPKRQVFKDRVVWCPFVGHIALRRYTFLFQITWNIVQYFKYFRRWLNHKARANIGYSYVFKEKEAEIVNPLMPPYATITCVFRKKCESPCEDNGQHEGPDQPRFACLSTWSAAIWLMHCKLVIR